MTIIIEMRDVHNTGIDIDLGIYTNKTEEMKKRVISVLEDFFPEIENKVGSSKEAIADGEEFEYRDEFDDFIKVIKSETIRVLTWNKGENSGVIEAIDSPEKNKSHQIGEWITDN